MPHKYESVDPEVFLTHKGVTIYHTYKDDDIDQGMRDYWYTTSKDEGECSGYDFDVRDLPGHNARSHENIIKDAIDAGLLKQDVKPAPEVRK